MIPFVATYPSLFHVTRRTSLPGIRLHGLLPAATFTFDGEGSLNRDGWTEADDGSGGSVWLRWQRMRDPVLAKRLPEDVTPAQWRAFINSMVFLFPSLDAAPGLESVSADEEIDQVILRFGSEAVLRAGCELRFCRWNNGYPDRAKPPRIRTINDYRPAVGWRKGDVCKEVTVAGGIPPSVPFELLS